MIDTFFSMQPSAISAFMIAAVLLNLAPGSDVMFTLASSLKGGTKNGVAAAAGISCGSLGHVTLTTLGLSALLQSSPNAYELIKYMGAAYLVYLAWKSWNAPVATPQHRSQGDLVRAFRQGFITNILNPKVALFILAFLPQFADPAIGPVWRQMAVLGILFAASGFLITGLYAIFAGLLASRLKAAGTFLNKISSLVFGALAARLVLD